VESSLSRYDPEPMAVYDRTFQGRDGAKKTFKCSAALEFINYLLTGIWQPVRLSRAPLSEYLGNAWIFAGVETIEIRTPAETRFAQGLDFKEYVTDTEAGFLNAMMYEDYEYILTQSFSFKDKYTGKAQLEVQQNQMRNAEDGSANQIEALGKAINDLVAGQFITGD
jgi:type IV secretory pathway VirB4 component